MSSLAIVNFQKVNCDLGYCIKAVTENGYRFLKTLQSPAERDILLANLMISKKIDLEEHDWGFIFNSTEEFQEHNTKGKMCPH